LDVSYKFAAVVGSLGIGYVSFTKHLMLTFGDRAFSPLLSNW
jgi:hypothetical protein